MHEFFVIYKNVGVWRLEVVVDACNDHEKQTDWNQDVGDYYIIGFFLDLLYQQIYDSNYVDSPNQLGKLVEKRVGKEPAFFSADGVYIEPYLFTNGKHI